MIEITAWGDSARREP